MPGNFHKLRLEYKPTLVKALAANDVSVFEKKIEKSGHKTFESELKCALDQIYKEFLLELIENDAPLQDLEHLIDLCIQTCRKGFTSLSMPVLLLSDIFELLTLDKCEYMFPYVERHVQVWKEDIFFAACKNNLLRMCNDLLRRLSRSTSTIFCGRILLFLANFFPFSERSGLNIVSEFNLENVTDYATTDDNFMEDDVTSATTESDIKKTIVDYNLYHKFWSLQDFFRNPIQCYNKVQWKLFRLHATDVLNAFEGLKLEYNFEKSSSTKTESKKIEEFCKEPLLEHISAGSYENRYFPKYLTNRKLFDLQLYDVNFRRSVLVQFLILFQYLTTNVRFKAENFELTSDQREWINNTMIERVYSLIRDTAPDGKKFATYILKILRREESWNTWKNDGCPEFRKISTNLGLADADTSTQKKSLGDAIKEANEKGIHYLGSPELTRLWNLYDSNLGACRASDRDFLPSLENYFSEAIEQLTSDTNSAAASNLLRDTNFGWRALRLVARRSPHFFTHSNQPISQLPVYLETMVKKIGGATTISNTGRLNVITTDSSGQSMRNEEATTDKIETADGEDNEAFKENQENNGEGETDAMDTDNNQNDLQEVDFVDDSSQDVDNGDPDVLTFKVASIGREDFEEICERISHDWRRVAQKLLNYQPDEIEYIASENSGSDKERAGVVLRMWFSEDDDATLENFAYILEGLELSEAADTIKKSILR